MKNIIIISVIIAVAAGIYFAKFHKSPVEKEYITYRRAVLESRGRITESNLHKWTTTIDSIRQDGDTAAVNATEVSYWIPINAASMNFATIITEKLYAELENKDGKWTVVNEETIEKSISDYEDRKNN